MHRLIFIFLFFMRHAMSSEEKSFLPAIIQSNFERICDITNYATDFLEDYNDRHLGQSEWGKMLGYEDMKPRHRASKATGRSRKKMMMGMMPLIFHVGATSTWMLLTTLLAAKSVAIGLVLLVFKIAVSTAKVASFFTLLKSKHDHGWSPHGPFSDRSLNEIPTHSDWNSHTPEWTHGDSQTGYKTASPYKDHSFNYGELEYDKIHADKKN